MGKHLVINPLSKCCKARIRVEGRETKYYVCDKCNKPTDPVRVNAEDYRIKEEKG